MRLALLPAVAHAIKAGVVALGLTVLSPLLRIPDVVYVVLLELGGRALLARLSTD